MQEISSSLDEVKYHFEHWRMTRFKNRESIPEYLWNEVKIIVDHCSLQDISQMLRINTRQIKDNIKIVTKINFVEVRPEISSLLASQKIVSFLNNDYIYFIEFHRVNGGVLKINALPVASLPAIITQFMA